LIDAAAQLIAEQGVDALTLREVAQRVGVSRMAPYRHFDDKSALLAAVAQEGLRKLTSYLMTVHEQTAAEPIDKLRAMGVAYVRYATAHPAYYRVMFGPFFDDKQAYPELYQDATACFNVLVQMLVTCQQTGPVRLSEPVQLAQIVWAQVHGLSMLLIDGQLAAMGSAPVDELAIAACQTLIEGLSVSG